MIYLNVRTEDLLSANVISQEQLDFVTNLRIPYGDVARLWSKKQQIDDIIMQAVDSGVVKEIVHEPCEIRKGPYIISDDLGVQGILNHADGKRYDSKSQYYKAVKDAGCVVMGNDAPTKSNYQGARINENELKRDIKEAIDQLGG